MSWQLRVGKGWGEGVGPRVCCVFLIRMDADGDDQQRGTSCGQEDYWGIPVGKRQSRGAACHGRSPEVTQWAAGAPFTASPLPAKARRKASAENKDEGGGAGE